MKLAIETVKAKNFKCFKECFVDFTDSKNIFIQGENGFGKTTIVEVIALCLNDYKKGQTYGDYVSWNTPKGECTEAELTCTINGEPLKVNISITEDGSLTRTCVYQDQTRAGTKVLELLETLGIRGFSDIMFYLQGSPDITNTTPSELSAQLQDLFDYDLSDFLEKLDASSLQNQESQVEKDIHAYRTQDFPLMDLEAQQYSKEEYDTAKDDIIKNQEKIVKIQQQLIDVNSRNEEKSKLSNRLVEISESKNSYSEKLQSISIYREQKAEYDTQKADLEAKVLEARNEFDEAATAHNEAKAFADQEISKLKLNLEIFNNKKELEEADKQSEAYELEISKLEPKAKDLREIIELHKEAIRVVKSMEAGICPTCHQPTTELCNLEEYNHLKAFTSQSSGQLSLALSESERELKLVEDRLNSLVSDQKFLMSKKASGLENYRNLVVPEDFKPEEVDSKITELQYQVSVKATKEADSSGKYNLQKSLLENLKVPLMPRFSVESVNNAVAELDKEKAEIEAKIQEIEKTLNSGKSSEELQRELKEIDISKAEYIIKEYERVETANKAILKYNEEQKARSEECAKKLEEAEKLLSNIQEDLKSYDEAKTIIGKDIPAFITVKTCEKLKNEINSFLNVVFPEMVVELKQKGKGVQFSYGLRDNPIKKSVKNASGFEKQLLSIAWKVALSKAYGISIIFLDEADAFSTPGNALKLYSKLLSLGLFDQVFVISQDSELYRSLNQNFDCSLFKVLNKGNLEKVVGA